MKKKENKKKRSDRQRDGMNALNSEIGSFGLEPPKIYRQEQRRTVQSPDNPSHSNRKKSSSVKKPVLTNEERQSLNSKKRKKKKKVRNIVSISLLCIVIFIVAVILLMVFGFKIDTIQIENAKTYSSEQIMAVLPIEKEKNLFLVDTKSAKEKLEKNLPYIYNAEIKRKLPSTIVVDISEPEHVYYIKNPDKSYTLIDDHFKVLEANIKSKPEKSVQIKKIALSSAVAGEKAKFTNEKLEPNIKELISAVQQYKLTEITAVYSEGLTSNYLVYDKRLTIKLGEADDLENKIFSALTAIEKLNESNPSAEGIITSTGGKQVYFTENK